MRSITAVSCFFVATLGLWLIGGYNKGSSFEESVPSEYRPFLKDGKEVKTGDPTLDYWVHLNMHLLLANRRKNPDTTPAPGFDTRPDRLRRDAKLMRSMPTAGVDEALVSWANRVADVFETQGNILGELNQPSGSLDQAAVIRLDQASLDWQAECDRVRAQGHDLRDSLSRRFKKAFPPCQF